MSDIFKEVDEEFQRDKVAMFFKRHGNLLFGLAVLVVLAVAGYRIYTYFEMKKAAEAGLAFEQAQALATEGKTAEAKAAFEALAKDAPAGYRALVQFRQAGELSKTDSAGAVKAFDALATDTNLDPTLRDLAKLRAGALLADTAPFAELQQRLDPLAAPGQAWRLSAREVLATAAMKAGNGAAAEKYLDQILSDPEATRTGRERAEILMALVRSGAKAQ